MKRLLKSLLNKKMQSLITFFNKLIRIFFAIGNKQFEFSEERMIKDIPHMRAKLPLQLWEGKKHLKTKPFLQQSVLLPAGIGTA
ncbi:hypothetical protein [Mesobacillus zeae]|uniref:Uncharacterized protein n=1 Tax=Mesobacillus zeae TaxID=1917180 RepID=A0A398BA85_9BACI|nr:hypothetical protein [Mesobacillus zeae]RID85758.1 hypothetical protein D1970_09460 [Mesobacillus zeae]